MTRQQWQTAAPIAAVVGLGAHLLVLAYVFNAPPLAQGSMVCFSAALVMVVIRWWL